MDRIVLLDSGDTLVDEATEEKDERGVTLHARLIPGAADLLRSLRRRGIRVALVADGFRDTFKNVFTEHALTDFFEVIVDSETVGVEKPDPLMFETALNALNRSSIPGNPAAAVAEPPIMVGNNLTRDIAGANRIGLISVFLDWSPRRRKTPMDPIEIPDYTIHSPLDLLDLLDITPLTKQERPGTE